MTLEDGISAHERIPRVESVGERIESAAVRYKGDVFMGPNHGMALSQLVEDDRYPNIDTDVLADTAEDGFVTSTGRFVNKGEAYILAEKQGQLKREFPGNTEGRELDSNDLKY